MNFWNKQKTKTAWNPQPKRTNWNQSLKSGTKKVKKVIRRRKKRRIHAQTSDG